MCDESSVKDAIAFVVEQLGRLDGAFNNAGAGGVWSPLHECDAETFDRVLATNLRGVSLCMKYEIAGQRPLLYTY